MTRSVLLLVIVLVLEGCASTPPPPASEPAEQDFDWAGQRYKVTREHGSSKLLLWHGEGITWELVGESPLRDSTLH